MLVEREIDFLEAVESLREKVWGSLVLLPPAGNKKKSWESIGVLRIFWHSHGFCTHLILGTLAHRSTCSAGALSMVISISAKLIKSATGIQRSAYMRPHPF